MTEGRRSFNLKHKYFITNTEPDTGANLIKYSYESLKVVSKSCHTNKSKKVFIGCTDCFVINVPKPIIE